MSEELSHPNYSKRFQLRLHCLQTLVKKLDTWQLDLAGMEVRREQRTRLVVLQEPGLLTLCAQGEGRWGVVCLWQETAGQRCALGGNNCQSDRQLWPWNFLLKNHSQTLFLFFFKSKKTTCCVG